MVVVGRGDPERGGIPTFLRMLTDSESELGLSVVLVNLANEEQRAGGRSMVGNICRTINDSYRVIRIVRSGDIVHVHSALAPTVTCLRAGLLIRAARLRRAHPVVHAHGGRLIDGLGTPWRRLITRRMLRPARMVIVVATGLHAGLIEAGLAPSQVRYLPNGVDVARFAAKREASEVPRVLFAGGITARKGVLDLLAASTMLLNEGVQHELWLVGGVPDEGAAAHSAVVEALPEHAVLTGPVAPEEMPEIYAHADIFCLPSWWEAMPLTVLEAQATGLPVVASDVGDVSRAVIDGRTGLLVPPQDRAALTGALRNLLRDPKRRAVMGDAGKTHVREHFTQERTIRGLASIFAEIEGA